ncbi:condensation domain-containing protein, partial [Pseudomonas aeruginosa]
GQLFQVLLNHQQRELTALRRLPGLLADELPWHSREAKFDLQLQSEEDARGRLTLNFDYAADLFDEASIRRFAAQYLELLRRRLRQVDTARQVRHRCLGRQAGGQLAGHRGAEGLQGRRLEQLA